MSHISRMMPGRQTWPSRFDDVQWTNQRPRPNQFFVEYNDVADIQRLICGDLPRIAIVGSREITPWGKQFINYLVDELARQKVPVVIVSGVCPGADETAHRAALRSGIPTIGILPILGFSRLRELQEEMLAKSGFMLSEYPQNTHMSGNLYLLRDGITTALADVVIPVCARMPGGTYATINRAVAQHKQVWAPRPPAREMQANQKLYAGVQEQSITRLISTKSDITDLIDLLTLVPEHA